MKVIDWVIMKVRHLNTSAPVKDSRWALGNEGDKEVHVIDEGGIVGAGQVFGLMFVSSCSIVVHVDETVLHTSHVAQILWQVFGVKGVLSLLWRRCED